MLTIFQTLQVEAAKLRSENRSLKSLGAAKHGQTSSAVSSASISTPQEDDATIRDFRAAGKQFTVLSDLWPHRSILRLPNPPLIEPWDSSRCANDAAWNAGTVAELYKVLPERYHEFIEHSALFSEKVSVPLYCPFI
jgi:hypothetical protein